MVIIVLQLLLLLLLLHLHHLLCLQIGSSNSVLQLQANFSLNGGGATNNGNPTFSVFPTIPNINGDIFSDTVPKQKLVNELDVMITLFNQGLEVLEEIL